MHYLRIDGSPGGPVFGLVDLQGEVYNEGGMHLSRGGDWSNDGIKRQIRHTYA